MITKSTFKDIYPVVTMEISKFDRQGQTVDSILSYLKDKINNNQIAIFISEFDHFSHTLRIGGEMMEGLLDAKNIIFCFGKAIPSTKAVALRPKSIGICEFKDKFIIEYIEPPNPEAAKIIEGWLNELSLL